MNVNYYNEYDKGAAAWLRELINAKLIPFGYVDERSITEVTASDVQGFTQCHFFAGIGGWPLALRLAGVPESTILWTGSPPCQPFSTAGKQLGQFDPRHLAPVFLNLISECRPSVLFGEQVAAAIGKSWMCDLQTHLEGEGYAVGFAVLPACGVGAPHKRDRLFFGARQLADTASTRHLRGQSAEAETRREPEQRHTGELPSRLSGYTISNIQQSAGVGSVADTDDTRPQGRAGVSERADQQPAGSGSLESGLAQPVRPERDSKRVQRPGESNQTQGSGATTEFTGCGNPGESTSSRHGFWSDADWLGCRDGKFRPVEPGTFPLANGIPARVGRLRGYGNAIVPQVAAEFIRAFDESVNSVSYCNKLTTETETNE